MSTTDAAEAGGVLMCLDRRLLGATRKLAAKMAAATTGAHPGAAPPVGWDVVHTRPSRLRRILLRAERSGQSVSLLLGVSDEQIRLGEDAAEASAGAAECGVSCLRLPQLLLVLPVSERAVADSGAGLGAFFKGIVASVVDEPFSLAEQADAQRWETLFDRLKRWGRSLRVSIDFSEPDKGLDPTTLSDLSGLSDLPTLSGQALARIMVRHGRAISPYDGAVLEAHETLDIACLLEAAYRRNDRKSFVFGAKYWNHRSIAANFAGPRGAAVFCDTLEQAVSGAEASDGQVLVWASQATAAVAATCDAVGVPLLRIEDGFIRSVGLGAGLAPGASLAVDRRGIYYDPSARCDLERLLQSARVTEEDRARGAALRQQLVASRVTKYNQGRRQAYRFPEGREIVLVPGQVADDAAIRKSRSATIACATTPNVNLDLLRAARAKAPDAFIVFKPHPDVESRLRKGKLSARKLSGLADFVARDADILSLIEACDRVETFSSLAGFEALIRGRPVTVHGTPFYAGWGLTTDLTPTPERTRVRSVDELLFLALVVYTRCVDPVSLLPCSPEFLIERLSAQRASFRHRLVARARREISWLGRKLGL
ncbi:hypothetical protein [Roseibium aestuarii]|uniref:capsular polysaccharide export protein, LipB/KpsS family n=1 Tax=Roseibium aestuarii TaxID=2600299 RepID=UPI00122F2182|nr:hypothetical protein [Roseibium aestuarii]